MPAKKKTLILGKRMRSMVFTSNKELYNHYRVMGISGKQVKVESILRRNRLLEKLTDRLSNDRDILIKEKHDLIEKYSDARKLEDNMGDQMADVQLRLREVIQQRDKLQAEVLAANGGDGNRVPLEDHLAVWEDLN